MKRQSSKQSGFTLVEIAIVLVIIGLLLGGVLKGQELITSSKAKALFADKTALQTAYNMYSDRYKQLPGDDSLAGITTVVTNGLPVGTAGRFTIAQCGGAECLNGGGNGAYTMAGAFNNVLAAAPVNGNAAENNKMYQHLRAAGFIKVEGTQGLTIFNPPANAAGNFFGFQVAAPFGLPPTSPLYFVTGNVPQNIAQALDVANDDGFSNAGGIRGNATAGAGTLYPAGAFNVSTALF
jgi:prepilin-type N-terminal cleavage/methylation domain-containing protein